MSPSIIYWHIQHWKGICHIFIQISPPTKFVFMKTIFMFFWGGGFMENFVLRNQIFCLNHDKCTVPAQEWLMGIIISLWIFSWSLGSLAVFCCSSSTAALQYATEEEGVVRLALSGPETLEGEGGASLPCKGWRGLHPPVCRVWGQVGRGKHKGEGPAYETVMLHCRIWYLTLPCWGVLPQEPQHLIVSKIHCTFTELNHVKWTESTGVCIIH